MINKKTRKVLDAGLSPILCVGETKEEYQLNLNKAICALQLSKGLAGVTKEEMARVTIAYEPVWAIGTGLTATPEIAQEVHSYIRSWLAQMYDKATADAVRIQYGGSVTPDTVDSLMACPGSDCPPCLPAEFVKLTCFFPQTLTVHWLAVPPFLPTSLSASFTTSKPWNKLEARWLVTLSSPAIRKSSNQKTGVVRRMCWPCSLRRVSCPVAPPTALLCETQFVVGTNAARSLILSQKWLDAAGNRRSGAPK